MSRKRGRNAPQLYDHNRAKAPARNFKRVRNGNSLILNTTMVASEAPSEEPLFVPVPTTSLSAQGAAFDPTSSYDDQHIPINPDTPETVGINVKPAKRYESSVSY